MPAEVLHALPGYGPDVAQNRKDAQEIMRGLGYGPDKRLSLKVSTRDIPPFRDAAVVLLDQLKEIYVDAELEPIDTTQCSQRGTGCSGFECRQATPGSRLGSAR